VLRNFGIGKKGDWEGNAWGKAGLNATWLVVISVEFDKGYGCLQRRRALSGLQEEVPIVIEKRRPF